MKRRRCRHEAKRTLTFHEPKARFIGRSPASFFMHRRCASLQPTQKGHRSVSFASVAEMGFEPHELPHQSHSRRLSLSQDYSSADSLLCGVSRRKNDNQSFLLVRRLFALRSQSDLGLITSKLVEYRLTTAAKKKELDTPNGVPSSFVKGL